MAPRTVACVVGLAFLLAGLVIMLIPLSTTSPIGLPVACGNSLGMGFDRIEVEAGTPAFVEICSRLRRDRLIWSGAVAMFGVVLLGTGVLVGRRFPVA